MDTESGFDVVRQHMSELLLLIATHKPNDRSAQDRYWAIFNTEIEKARAIFLTYCQPPQTGETQVASSPAA